jgi:hypothetical protein
MKINLDDLTIGEAKQLAALFSQSPALSALPTNATAPYEVGKPYFIRTVTHHYTGLLIAVHPGELVLEKCCWIADDGRFSDALKTGKFNEIEPFPSDANVIIGRGSIVDAVILNAELPASQK